MQIMNGNEISESIPQGKLRGGDDALCGVGEIADRLRNRIEADQGAGGALPSAVSRRSGSPTTDAIVEAYAKEVRLWIPIADTLGWRKVAGGNENDVFLREDGWIYKINNLMNDGGVIPLLERIQLHNRYFPETSYEIVGFTGFEGGSVFPVLRQRYVGNVVEASVIEIDVYMSRLGFKKIGSYAYSNGEVMVDDLRPRNVLKDDNGIFYVIDAGLKTI